MTRKRSTSRSESGKVARKFLPTKRLFPNRALTFLLGVALTVGAFLLLGQGELIGSRKSKSSTGTIKESSNGTGKRNVDQLLALTDEQLEKTDLIELNLAVAREIPGLEKLDYDHYRCTVDDWTGKFRRWLPTVEHAFHQAPDKYKNDINFFRLGMLAQFLDQKVGIAYVEEQKRAQIKDRKAGKRTGVRYTDPGQLLLYGLIDTKRGTCATMPVLHVAMGRRLGWPVGLACANWHYVCRYDDGQRVYNIETTDTGRGGFAEGSDADYIEKEGVSSKAIAVGSDLRKLTAREMLGVFIMSRGRYLADTEKRQAAARDFALAHTLFPSSRKAYIQLTTNLIATGEALFALGEEGHPAQQILWRMGRYRSFLTHVAGPVGYPTQRPDPFAEIDRINAINRANMQRMMQPPHQPHLPQPYQPPRPGYPQNRHQQHRRR